LYIPCTLRGKGLGESGGPSLKGKGGLVGFRRFLKVQGRTGGFSKKNLRFKEVLVGFRKTSLALREVFRKPFSSPIF